MFHWTWECISFRVSVFTYFESGIARLYAHFTFNFLRSLHPVFYSGWTNLYSHQQCCATFPFSPYPSWYLLFLAILIIIIIIIRYYNAYNNYYIINIIIIITGVWWYLTVVLICISLSFAFIICKCYCIFLLLTSGTFSCNYRPSVCLFWKNTYSDIKI